MFDCKNREIKNKKQVDKRKFNNQMKLPKIKMRPPQGFEINTRINSSHKISTKPSSNKNLTKKYNISKTGP